MTGKLTRVIDESIQHYNELQQQRERALPNMEFNRRVAMEKETEKTDYLHFTRLAFDESGNFLLVPTMIGIKVVNLVTNRLARLIGKPENMRFLQLALIQVSYSNKIIHDFLLQTSAFSRWFLGKS